MSSLVDAWKKLFDHAAVQGTHAERAAEIKAWQKTLLEEHEGLRDELELLLRTYVRTIDRFVERANQLTEEQFLREQETIESIRKILMNAVRRLEVSCKDHRELMDEWHEWVAFRRAAGEKHELTPAHKQRVEMIRSELALRGFETEEPKPFHISATKPVAQEEGPQQVERVTDVLHPAPRALAPAQLDELADWIALRRQHVEPEYHAAEQAWHGIKEQAHNRPIEALQALKRLKDAHADLRLLDRPQGRIRYRVAVFVA